MADAAASAARPIKARRLESAGPFQEARQKLREALGRTPASLSLAHEYARMTTAAGDLRGAQAVAERRRVEASDVAPDDDGLKMELARQHLQQRRLSAAEQEFTRLAHLWPSDAVVFNELMEVFCRRVEDHEMDLPGGPVDPALLERFLTALRAPGRHKLLSVETHLRIAETLARMNHVEAALASLLFVLNQVDFAVESLRKFTTKLLRPVVTDERVIPFHDSRALAILLTQLGNGFAATHEFYQAQASYYLAFAADRESWAARFNLAFLDIARGDVLGVLQHLRGGSEIASDQAGLVVWPMLMARPWPDNFFEQGRAFEKLKPTGKPWPKITVIAHSLQRRDDVEETLLSVVNQAYPALEFIVVDGGSTDGAREVVKQYRKSLTRVLIEPNQGRAVAINSGLQKATGEVVLWLDAGDMLAPGALFAVALSCLEDQADLIAGFCLHHRNRRFHGIDRPRLTQATFNVECLGDSLGFRPKADDSYRHVVAFSRRILDKVGGKLDQRLSSAVDYEFWMRCAAVGGRLSVISWPIALRREGPEQISTSLTERILEQSRVRDRFVLVEPSLRRRFEIKQRLGLAFAQPVSEVAVVSTRAATIFSHDTTRELREAFAGQGLNVRFMDSVEAVANVQPDLIVLLVHLYNERQSLCDLRTAGYQGPIVGWFWDNHHLIFDNYEEAQELDVCVPGHAFAANYLRSRRSLMGAPVPLCTTQWSGAQAGQFFAAHGFAQRSDVMYGGFVKHATAAKRNAFAAQLVAAGFEGVSLLEKDTLNQYFGMSVNERFKVWASHKVSLCLPLDGDLSQRLFDALLSGQIPIVPPDIYDLDSVIPRKLQNRLPIVRMGEYSLNAVREAHARAIELFDQQGKAGILRRHRFAMANHLFASRIATIISNLRETAGRLGQQLASERLAVTLPQQTILRGLQAGSSPPTQTATPARGDNEDIRAESLPPLPGDRDLARGPRTDKNVLFFRSEYGPCCAALHKTLDVLRTHYPSLSDYVIVADTSSEHTGASSNTSNGSELLLTSSEVLDELSSRAGGIELNGIGELAERLASDARDSACLSLSARSLAREAIAKSRQFKERLAGVWEPATGLVAGACLVTSLYDEQNLLRLIEYLACLVVNLEIFERVVILYESKDNLASAVVQRLAEEMGVPAGRLLLLPYQKRPTFDELFATGGMFPAGTVIVVANADIAFDASFARIAQVDLAKDIVVLSRHDISNDGSKARLIHLESGVPNTFSVDAWVFATPCEEDFFLDYPLGSFHCDSFINHQISTSSRYGVLNPCHDIKIWHLHDERFNSSAEKQTRDHQEIQRRYGSERERNEGRDPIRGVAWTTLATASLIPTELQFQRWKYKGLVFDLAGSGQPTFGSLLILHYLLSSVPTLMNDAVAVIKLRTADLNGTLGMLLAQYQKFFRRDSFLVDTDGSDCDRANRTPENVATQTVSFATLADQIVAGSSESDWDRLVWPRAEGKLLRCEIIGDLSAQATTALLETLRLHSTSWNALSEFFASLPPDSAERRLLAPFMVPLMQSTVVGRWGRNRVRGGRNRAKGRPKVSLVTSLFDGGDFLPGYLHNVSLAAQEAEGEVIIVDANPDERDERVVTAFLDSYPSARHYVDYIHLDRDPGLYECWRIGIERARAELITNANVDDRRCPSHTARLVQLLNEHSEYAGACGSISCVKADATDDWFTLCDNQLWFYGEGLVEIGLNDLYRVNERGVVLSRNVMHCMPVWRKSLHARYGFFDEAAYGTSADWAFWLKCAKGGEKFVFEQSAFGRYFLNPQSHNRRNDPKGVKERRIIKDFLGVEQVPFVKQ